MFACGTVQLVFGCGGLGAWWTREVLARAMWPDGLAVCGLNGCGTCGMQRYSRLME